MMIRNDTIAVLVLSVMYHVVLEVVRDVLVPMAIAALLLCVLITISVFLHGMILQ